MFEKNYYYFCPHFGGFWFKVVSELRPGVAGIKIRWNKLPNTCDTRAMFLAEDGKVGFINIPTSVRPEGDSTLSHDGYAKVTPTYFAPAYMIDNNPDFAKVQL